MIRDLAIRVLTVCLLVGSVAGCGASGQPVRSASARAIDLRTPTFQTSSYDFYSDLPADDFKRVVEHMELMHAEYARRFARYQPRDSERMSVWVFATQRGYLEFLATNQTDGRGTGGIFFVNANARGLAAWVGDQPLERVLGVLRHEGLHQFLYQRVGTNVPQWLNEGLAEYFQYMFLGDRRSTAGLVDPSSLTRLKQAQAENRILPLVDLLTLSNERWIGLVNTGDPRAGVIYPQAWSVVHFLVEADGGKYENLLIGLVDRFQQGVPHEQAVRMTFGSDLAPMDRAWRKHIHEMQPDATLIAHAQLEAAARVLLEAWKGGAFRERQARIDLRDYVNSEYGNAASIPLDIVEYVGRQRDWWVEQHAGSPRLRAIPSRDGTPPEVEAKGRRHTLTLRWSPDGNSLKPRIEVR